jgi:agmatinase
MDIPSRDLPINFCGLTPPGCDYDAARFVVLPAPYEGTVTYQKGTAAGPRAVLDASRYVERYDEVLRVVTADLGIHTLEPLEVQPACEAMTAEVERVAAQVLADKKVFCMIGGEHSLTLGAVKAFKKTYDEMCVLQLDAHADLRDTYGGEKFSHATVMRRCLEVAPLTQVGIRSLSKEEAGLLETDPNVTTYFAHDLRERGLAATTGEILSTLTDEVYLTIDIDVFDPAFVPGTGTPEPGGLDWYDVASFLRALSAQKQIVGFDIVEVMPQSGTAVSEFLAAKLAYRTMGCIAEAAGWLKTA